MEEMVNAPGGIVRGLKAKSTKSAKDQATVMKAVDGLKGLKVELAMCQQKVRAAAVAN